MCCDVCVYILCILVNVSIYYLAKISIIKKKKEKKSELIVNFILIRYIDLTPSAYDDAKKTITNDAFLNGKRFAGESEDEDDKLTTTTTTTTATATTTTSNNNNNNGRNKRSRSKSERRSRSTSRDRRQQPIKRRHSASKSPRSRRK